MISTTNTPVSKEAAEIGLVVDLDAAVAEDLDGGFGKFVGNENAGSHLKPLQDV